jgi:hypothetical protein
MGRACNMKGGEAECMCDIGGKIQKKRDHWDEQDIGGCIILKWFLER